MAASVDNKHKIRDKADEFELKSADGPEDIDENLIIERGRTLAKLEAGPEMLQLIDDAR